MLADHGARGDARRISTVVVFTGGERTVGPGERLVVPDGFVIAADSGLEHAMAAGHHVDLVVGDMDSVDPGVLEAALGAGARIERHPAVKDETDLEIALGRAMSLGATKVVTVGGWGDRPDHVLANMMLLGSQRYSGMIMEAYLPNGRLYVVRDRLELSGAPGDLVSLLALHGDVSAITTSGLAYPLVAETLRVATTRGVSNEMTGRCATIEVGGGVLSVLVPGRSGAHVLSGLVGTGVEPGTTPGIVSDGEVG